MKTCLLCATLLSMLPMLGWCVPVPDGFKEDGKYKSASESTIVRAYRKESPPVGLVQMRVFQEDGLDKDGELIWEGENRPWALVSPNGASIAINQHAGSDTGLLFVFVRQKSGSYQKNRIGVSGGSFEAFRAKQKAENGTGIRSPLLLCRDLADKPSVAWKTIRPHVRPT